MVDDENVPTRGRNRHKVRERRFPFIRVWRFDQAPNSLRKLSTNGGDEDWLAFVPERLVDEYIPWLYEGSAFGCCAVDVFTVPGGRVFIGSHA